jgi:hypothetical protein
MPITFSYRIKALQNLRLWLAGFHEISGLACDPETGEVIPCTSGYIRPPSSIYRGRTAKEISVEILEKESKFTCTHLEHANYLGREFQRAEFALLTGKKYIQD